MLPKKYGAALTISFNPSRSLKYLFISIYVLTFSLLLVGNIDIWLSIVTLLILLWQGKKHYECYIKYSTPYGIKSLQWEQNGCCLIYFNHHERCIVKSISSVFYCRWCIGFYIHLRNKRLVLFIPTDMLDPDSFRRLYLRLKIKTA